MELKGTIQSIQTFEDKLIKCYPYRITHDGGEPYDKEGKEGEPQLRHRSPYYARVYQLFPDGTKGIATLWEKRVNARFFYDERYGVGTVRISKEGMEMLSSNITDLIPVVEDVWIIPKKHMTHLVAKKYGATNMNGDVKDG